MGEVYRAKDTRLEREVAIKVLPEELADDEERLRRFEREAKTLASLNHPNVAGIHGVDQEGDVYFLALELVPGRGPGRTRLSSADRWPWTKRSTCAGRSPRGWRRRTRPASCTATSSRPTCASRPTVWSRSSTSGWPSRSTRSEPAGAVDERESDSFLMTEEGMILGTPTYMSPEQARGKPVDRAHGHLGLRLRALRVPHGPSRVRGRDLRRPDRGDPRQDEVDLGASCRPGRRRACAS